MPGTPYMSDPSIIPRVQKYLESNVDKTHIDINVMADQLQKMYKEYSRRKQSAFRASVKKAYSIILESYSISNSDSDEDSNDCELDETSPKSSRPPSTPQNGTKFTNLNSNTHIDNSSNSQSRKRNLSATPSKSISKKKENNMHIEPIKLTLNDIGGAADTKIQIYDMVMHLKQPGVYKDLGVRPTTGFLLYGPTGAGKTLFARALAGDLGIPMLQVGATELVAGISGESEQRIRELFDRAANLAPCILFIDEIDNISQNRENAQKDMERRIVSQLAMCFDELNLKEAGASVVVIGATRRLDAIDLSLRREGRFENEICIGVPNEQDRVEILKILTSGKKLSENFDFNRIAKYTPGYVGADLKALISKACATAVIRLMLKLKDNPKLATPLTNLENMVEVSPSKRRRVDTKTDGHKSTDTDIIIIEDDILEPADSSPSHDSSKQDSNVVVMDLNEDAATNITTTKALETVETAAGPNNVETLPAKDAPLVENAAEQVNSASRNPEPMPVEDEMTTSTKLKLRQYWLQAPKIQSDETKDEFVTEDDFLEGIKTVQPSSKREGFATVPDVTWNDVGSLTDVKRVLQMSILVSVKYPEKVKALNLSIPSGVLLCGPPGCGKTLLAKALANEAGINFISVKGPELLNMYVGESERAVRLCFERARVSAPCVIFFDELDALCPKRSDSREATMRVVNQMLTEMDGMESRKQVFVLAASNRPDVIDPAMLRPGRLDKTVYVGLPTPADRVDILRTITKNGTKPMLAPEVDLNAIGQSKRCSRYTGADLASLVREASLKALEESLETGNSQKSLLVKQLHFFKALLTIRPSVSEKDLEHYERFKKLYTEVPCEENTVDVNDFL